MSLFQIRPYQVKAEADIREAWKSSRSVCLVMPTGSGKTFVFSQIVKKHGKPTVIVCHRNEINMQISLSLAKHGVRHMIIGSNESVRFMNRLHMDELGKSYCDPQSQIAVASVDTLVRRPELIPFLNRVDLFIGDEGHHFLKENKWGKALSLAKNATKVLGVTAAAIRADGKGLGSHHDGIYDALVMGPEPAELIREGYLCPYVLYAPQSKLDFMVLKEGANGDYTRQSAKAAMKDSSIVGDIVDNYLELAPGKTGLTFLPDLETCQFVKEQFLSKGVPAEIISGKNTDTERYNMIKKYRNKDILQLISVDLIGEGFDVPSCEVIQLARITKSFQLLRQQLGRVMRPFPGKVGIIIDHVGNTIQMQCTPDSRKVYSLDRRDKRSTVKDTIIPIKSCPNPQCNQVFERVYKTCPYCGFTPEPLARSGPEFVDGDLTMLGPEDLAKLRGYEVDVEMTANDYLAQSGAIYLPDIPRKAAVKRFRENQEAQNRLRLTMAKWAGIQRHLGKPDSESYRRFWFMFGMDVVSAKALNSKGAEDLINKLQKEIEPYEVLYNWNNGLRPTNRE